YQVRASVQDSGGNSTTLSSTFVVGTSISSFVGILGIDPTVNATEGTSFSGSVGTFIDSDGNTNPALYTATINWGDGTGTSSGTVTGSGGTNGVTVSGTHTYAEEGSFAVRVSITDTDTSTYTINSTALVADAGWTVSNVA